MGQPVLYSTSILPVITQLDQRLGSFTGALAVDVKNQHSDLRPATPEDMFWDRPTAYQSH